MLRHNQMDYLRDRIAFEDDLALTASTREARQIHADLAMQYRAELANLKARQMRRFAGIG